MMFLADILFVRRIIRMRMPMPSGRSTVARALQQLLDRLDRLRLAMMNSAMPR